jgi:hypothetical protein
MAAPVPGQPFDPGKCAAPAQRLWKLTPNQYERTVKSLLPGAAGFGTRLAQTLAVPEKGFGNAAGVLQLGAAHAEQLYANAGELAAQAMGLYPCAGQQQSDATCARVFIADFARKAIRRPLAADEVARYAGLWTQLLPERGGRAAFFHVARAIFLSADFLFRTELGSGAEVAPGVVALTPSERASAVSYFLTDGPPDAQLLAAAEHNQLEGPEQIAVHARRLLASAPSAEGLLGFFQQHLRYGDVRDVQKEERVVKDFAGLASSMARETELFIEHVLWKEGARFDSLLTANYTIILDGSLVALYKASSMGKDEFQKRTLPPGERSGLLTQGSFLARAATANETDAVARGRFVRSTLLCQEAPPPPLNVNAVPPPPSKTLTMRERLAQHSADPTCAPCHRLMDPLGLAFENYDTLGRYRTLENGKAIDAGGMVIEFDAAEPRYGNALELGRLLARSKTARSCFVTRLYEYGHGRGAGKLDACALETLQQRFDASNGNVIELAAAIASSESFAFRSKVN